MSYVDRFAVMFEPFSQIDGVLDKGVDPRSAKWVLISPLSFFLSLCVYMLIVKLFLPLYMKNRKPYDLKNTLIIYNVAQVAISAYLFILAVDGWFNPPESTFWRCNSVDRSNQPKGRKEAFALYLFLLSKYVEFFDTFFFILRKKYNQVSFLHVYHHVSTPVFIWFVVRYYPGGSFIFLMMFNTFIHVIMYTYYMLAALGPHVQKYLWWKKYITVLQLTQFVVCLTHFVLTAFSSKCNISPSASMSIVVNSLFLYFLFSNFFNKQYKKGEQKKKECRPEFVLSPWRSKMIKNHKGLRKNKQILL